MEGVESLHGNERAYAPCNRMVGQTDVMSSAFVVGIHRTVGVALAATVHTRFVG